jgi:hypothetical protein
MTNQEKFDAYVSQFNAASQNWLRKHPECVTDPRLNRKILRVHQEAVEDQGLEAETAEYFDYVDQRMGYAPAEDDVSLDDGGGDQSLRATPRPQQRQERQMPQNQRGSDQGAAQYTQNRAQSPVMRSAPVRGGDTARAVQGGRREITLTAGEITHATDGTIPWREHDAPEPSMVGEPIGTKEYARRKLLMGKAGRYMSNGE